MNKGRVRGMGVAFLLLLSCICGGCHRKEKTYRIGIDETWRGAHFGDLEQNVTRFSEELLLEMSVLAQGCAIEKISINGMGPRIPEGCDAVFSSLLPRILYEESFLFSEAYLLTGPILVVGREEGISSLDDLHGKRIGLMESSLIGALEEKYPYIQLQLYSSERDLLQGILEGAVDGGLLNLLLASRYLKGELGPYLKMVGHPINEEGLRLLARKNKSPDGESEIIEWFNRSLRLLIEKGVYRELLVKWGLACP